MGKSRKTETGDYNNHNGILHGEKWIIFCNSLVETGLPMVGINSANASGFQYPKLLFMVSGMVYIMKPKYKWFTTIKTIGIYTSELNSEVVIAQFIWAFSGGNEYR